MQYKIVLLTTLLALAAACSPTATNPVFEAGPLVLQPGQSADDVQSGSVLTFTEIVQDSRCPADAICVTSGFVQARFLN